MAAASPTVRRRRLGIEMRRLRERSGLLIETVARELECSMSKISRIETGKAVARTRDIRDMLTMYGVTDEKQRDLLLGLTREAQRHGWWEQYDRVLPPGLNTYIGLEAEAAVVRGYEPHVVPGLLQTAEYARAVDAGARYTPNRGDAEHFLTALLTRQERLVDTYDPLRVHMVVDESVLRRPVGGPEVAAAQLRHLAGLAGRPNITVQILPLADAGEVGLGGQFVLLEFAEPADDDLAFVDTPLDVLCLQKTSEVQWYRSAHDQVVRAALSPEESRDFIEAAARSMWPKEDAA
jgi:transcriptional regulator with XRE-family HTH domain